MLTPVSFADLPNWADDDHASAFSAFRVSARRMVDKPYKTRALGVDAAALQRVAALALEIEDVSGNPARQFFEHHFTPHFLAPGPERSHGFLTGFFEPQVDASRQEGADYPVPLYRRPAELIDVDDATRPASMDPGYRFGRKTTDGVEEYFDRGAVQSGALAGRDLELVWLRNKVDAFIVHIQGSARLVLSDGGTMRVTYAAKSGHPYTSLGKVMCERLDVPTSQMTMDVLCGWMRDHPEDVDDLLALNRSFIFFEEVPNLNTHDGPIAAAKVPLIAGRSLAVDRTLHTFGSPLWIATKTSLPGEQNVAQKLMIAHDTGSAIVGPARGDIFVGTGAEAGDTAGRIQHDADMFVLVPTL